MGEIAGEVAQRILRRQFARVGDAAALDRARDDLDGVGFKSAEPLDRCGPGHRACVVGQLASLRVPGVLVKRRAHEPAQLLPCGGRDRQLVDQPVVVAVYDCHLVDMNAVRIRGEGDRADIELVGQFLGRRAAVDEQRACVRRDAPDGNAQCASPDVIACLENDDVGSRVSQEISGGDAGWAGTDDGQVRH
jgi:hypothetical protein